MLSKTESVWRHLLADHDAEGRRRWPSVTALAHDLGMPVSTTHKALAAPVRSGAVKVHGGGLVQLLDPYRLAVLWAGRRRLDNDILGARHVGVPVADAERELADAGCVLGAFSAVVARRGHNNISDYTTVLAYAPSLDRVPGRLRPAPGQDDDPPDDSPAPTRTRVLVARADPLLSRYGTATPLAQAWADLFGIGDWQSTYFTNELATAWLPDAA